MMGYMWDYGDLGGGWSWGMMLFSGIIWLLVVVALILLIIWLLKQIKK